MSNGRENCVDRGVMNLMDKKNLFLVRLVFGEPGSLLLGRGIVFLV